MRALPYYPVGAAGLLVAAVAAVVAGCGSLPEDLREIVPATTTTTTTTTTTIPPGPAGYTQELGVPVTITVPSGHENAGKRFGAYASGYMDYYGRHAANAVRGAVTMFHDQHGGAEFPEARIVATWVRVLGHFPDPWRAVDGAGNAHRWVSRVAVVWQLEHGYWLHAGINHGNDGVIGCMHPDGSWQEGVYYVRCDRVVGMTTIQGNHRREYKGMPVHLRD
jgi:hypothetical protein